MPPQQNEQQQEEVTAVRHAPEEQSPTLPTTTAAAAAVGERGGQQQRTHHDPSPRVQQQQRHATERQDRQRQDHHREHRQRQREEQAARFRRHCRTFYRGATSIAAVADSTSGSSSGSSSSRQNSSTAASSATAGSSGSSGGGNGGQGRRPRQIGADSSDGGLGGGGGGGSRGGSRAVMEALEHLTHHVRHCDGSTVASVSTGNPPAQACSYQNFLAQNVRHRMTLSECGLPLTHPATFVAANPKLVERYVQIRTEERASAHADQMVVRRSSLLVMLDELQGLESEEDEDGLDGQRCGGGGDDGVNAVGAVKGRQRQGRQPRRTASTTRAQVKRIRSTVQKFVRKYCKDNVASHSFLAGLRQVLECQIGGGSSSGSGSGGGGGGSRSGKASNGTAKTPSNCGRTCVAVRWTFDGAVLTEAIRTKGDGTGGHDSYVRDALDVITSFMVWIRGGVDDDASGCGGEVSVSRGEMIPDHGLITFEIDPKLSDRTLRKVLDVLPRRKELHCRPTGTVAVPKEEEEEENDGGEVGRETGGTVRTNVDGAWDEKDVCHDFLENAFGGLRVAFCQK